MQTEITAVTILHVVMKFTKVCSLDMGICIKAIIVLSSYFGILQSASEQQAGINPDCIKSSFVLL